MPDNTPRNDDDFNLEDVMIPPAELAEMERLALERAAETGRLPKRLAGAFALVDIPQAIAAFLAIGNTTGLVWLHIVRLQRLRKTAFVTVTSAGLQAWGVDRYVKRRALDRLEAAGLIEVRRKPGCNPRVRLIPQDRPPTILDVE